MTISIKTVCAALAMIASAGEVRATDVDTIGLAVPNLRADFFDHIEAGVKDYAAAKGIEVIAIDSGNDADRQANQVRDMIAQGIDAFIYIPAEGTAAAAIPTRLARQEGIPVVNVDRVPEGEPGDTFIAGESVNAAFAVCDHMIRLQGGQGKMAIIHGQKGTTPEVDRTTGCSRAIDENPGVELVAQQWSKEWSPDEGFSIARGMLQADPDITIIFGQSDSLAMGAAKAVEVAGLTDQVVVGGYDGDVATLQLLAKCEGPFWVTATQSTEMMSRLAVDSALALAAGEAVPKRQVSDAVLTTCANVKRFLAQHP